MKKTTSPLMSAAAVLVLALSMVTACAYIPRLAKHRGPDEVIVPTEIPETPKAVDLATGPLPEKPADRPLMSLRVEAVEDMKAAADAAFQRQDYATAERAYRALLEGFHDFEPFASELTFTRAGLDESLRACRLGSADLWHRQHMKAGKYDRALDPYRSLLLDYPDDPAASDKLVRAGLEIKAVGDLALAAEDFSLAGKAYNALLNDEASLNKIRSKAGFTRESLEKSLAQCRTNLTNSGLADYRKGNLEAAIIAWESLLAFDPDNTEIKNAVETAKAQREKLKK